MQGMLLITWKNGRALKTYGVNRFGVCNMKLAFPCIVTIISCSVCASGELEIYPGLKFDLSSQEQRHHLDNDDGAAQLYGDAYQSRWPWLQNDPRLQGPPLDDYGDDSPPPSRNKFDFAHSEQLRTLEELLDRNRMKYKELPFYYNPRFAEAVEGYRNMEKARNNRYNSRYPNAQILDDVRPYPHEDDFTFGEEQEDEGDDEEEVEEEGEEREPRQRDTKQMTGTVHRAVQEKNVRPLAADAAVERSTEEASGKGALALDNVKFVEDPTQFAYPPSDPRFFQTTEISGGHQILPVMSAVHEKLRDNKILLNQRSDDRFPLAAHGEIDNELSLSADDQKTGNNQVEVVAVRPQLESAESAGVYIIAVVAGISAAATVGLIAVGIGWYNLQKHVKNASDVEYPAYGVTGPNKDASPSGDRRLAQSAQMYHYQHQKQQIIAMESRQAAGERHGSVSEADSDEENEEGDYTVYECPGLAPTGEMEVKNPLFQDDPTPAQTPPVKPNGAAAEEKK